MKAYEAWLAEVKEMLPQDGVQEPSEAAQPEPSAEPPAPSPPLRTEPVAPVTGGIRRRVETATGQAYDVVIERAAGSWFLTIHQFPRQPGVTDPDLQEAFSDYAEADRALKDFVRKH